MFGFIIAACIREESHLNSLNDCLSSIEQFHLKNKCVVIIDFTSDKTLVKKIIENFPNVIFELETSNYPADMQLLKFFKEKKYFNTAILLQDSMRVLKEFKIENILDIQYIWHFNNHRIQWDTIREPCTDYNIKNNINTHSDLICHVIDSLPDTYFKEYCKITYPQKNLWSGCFGCLCIITYDFLQILDSKTDIINIQSNMITNRLRRVIESIFSLACEYAIGKHITSSYDGLYYDGVTNNGISHSMKSEHLHKICFDRQ
jgi:hypothetical protein